MFITENKNGYSNHIIKQGKCSFKEHTLSAAAAPNGVSRLQLTPSNGDNSFCPLCDVARCFEDFYRMKLLGCKKYMFVCTIDYGFVVIIT